MQPVATPRIPKYRLHKPTGLGVVRLNGRDIYLGKHATPESHAEYRRVIAEWLASAKQAIFTDPTADVSGLTVNELILRYRDHAKSYYVKNGRPTGELANLKDAFKPLASTHGRAAVSEFGPISLKAVRQAMIDSGWCRGVVNARVNRIRRMFKWGVENQLISPTILHGLQAVALLKRGRCEVRESEPVIPVPDAMVDAVIKVAPPQIAAMIELQRLTGMRPGEVVLIRTADIDTTGPIWSFTPREHKTEHHGRRRVIHLGPKAQEVLKPFLKTDISAFIFTPAEVMENHARSRRTGRRSPLTPSQTARLGHGLRKRQRRPRYTTTSYARAIAYACDWAFPHPVIAAIPHRKRTAEHRMQLEAWRRENRWSPNRLRHNAATGLRKQFGIEAARVVLGHSSARVTEVYAEQDFSKAAEIMERVG